MTVLGPPPRPPRSRKAWGSATRERDCHRSTAIAAAWTSRAFRAVAPRPGCACPIASCRMAEITALVADDEPLARRGVRQLLAPYTDIAVVGECKNGREVVRAITTLKPDLVFLDIQMPGLDGLGAIRVYGAERMP